MTNPNEYAFPRDHNSQYGLTIRQYFAGLAMQGLCALYVPDCPLMKEEEIASYAVQQADALIAELNKGQ